MGEGALSRREFLKSAATWVASSRSATAWTSIPLRCSSTLTWTACCSP